MSKLSSRSLPSVKWAIEQASLGGLGTRLRAFSALPRLPNAIASRVLHTQRYSLIPSRTLDTASARSWGNEGLARETNSASIELLPCFQEMVRSN